MSHENTFQDLLDHLATLERVAIAFSGGVDSSLLLYAAHQALGDRTTALTVKTPYIPEWEIEETSTFTSAHSMSHVVIDLKIPADIRHNPPDRCYHCKKHLFSEIIAEAGRLGIDTIAEGSNKDDLSDYRPGLRALEELQIVSPFLQLGITKNQIRGMARHLGLDVWNKPSNACLLSRIPYETEITENELTRAGCGEAVLRDLKLFGSRVRSHGDIARVEIPGERFMDVLSPELRVELVSRLKSCGYLYVALDLEGYQTGSMNRDIS